MGSKEDHLRQPFHFVCVFQECPSVSVCVYSVCAFCHLVQCFSLIPRIGQAEITPQGLVLKHFKDFCRVTEDSSLVVLPCKLIIFCRNEWPVYKVAWPEERTFHLPIIYRVKVSFMRPGTIWTKCRISPCGNTWCRSPLFG
jgi:hypothetical protein